MILGIDISRDEEIEICAFRVWKNISVFLKLNDLFSYKMEQEWLFVLIFTADLLKSAIDLQSKLSSKIIFKNCNHFPPQNVKNIGKNDINWTMYGRRVKTTRFSSEMF